METAVACVKAGAHNFLTKPLPSNEVLVVAIEKAVEHRFLAQRAQRLEEELDARARFGEMLGSSPAMQAVYRVLEGIAPTTSTVLIQGESGTGKELVARALHQHSPRAKAPFLAVNCAAIPKDLVESELFGHLRGAFTGAGAPRAGLFESANGGSVLLDEIGDLPLASQVKLLRVLQEGEVKRVGLDETRRVDVRIIAATNVDLRHRLEAGEFRSDLYYRLNVVPIMLPPLRDRGDDVLLLTEHFLHKMARKLERPTKKLSAASAAAIRASLWPGNVRELEHAIERGMLLSRGDSIEPADLGLAPAPERAPAPSTRALASLAVAPVADEAPTAGISELLDLPYPEAKRRLLSTFDETYCSQLVERCGGNMAEAARKSGLDRSNFRRIIRRAKRPA